MGEVHLAQRATEAGSGATGGLERVALKVMQVPPGLSSSRVERFQQEARAGQSIEHENVARTLDAGAVEAGDGGTLLYMAMELVDGQSARALLGQLKQLPESLCRHVGREVGKGLAAVHEAGFVHRDVKPSNIIITTFDVVKLLDLGVAFQVEAAHGPDAARMTRTGDFVGTWHYAPPEQMAGTGATPEPSWDLYALGATLYELATGRTFMADRMGSTRAGPIDWSALETPAGEDDVTRSLSGTRIELSRFFRTLLEHLLEPDPSRRLRSATTVVEALMGGEDSAWFKGLASEEGRVAAPAARRLCPIHATPHLGRVSLLGQLEEQIHEALRGHGAGILVLGEAGIGKSRLMDELISRMADHTAPPRVLFGAHPPGGAATAHGAFLEALREHFGSTARTDIEKLLAATPGLGRGLARTISDDGTATSAGLADRAAFQTAAVRAVQALAAEGPVVLILEDLHFGGEGSRALFAALAAAATERRIVVIGTAREDLPDAWLADLERLPHVHTAHVGRMDDDISAAVLDALGDEGVPPGRLRREVIGAAGGNPHFLLSLARHVREGPQGPVPGATGLPRTTATTSAGIDIPAALRETLEARLGRLDDEDREHLELAACIGSAFDPGLVARVQAHIEGTSRDLFIAVTRRLGRIARATGIVRAEGESFAFDHKLMQQVLYLGLPSGLRARYHRTLAEILADEGAPAARSREIRIQIARHALAGGDVVRSEDVLPDALDVLTRTFQHDTSLDLLEQYRALPGVADRPRHTGFVLAQLRTLREAGRLGEYLPEVEEALRIVRMHGDAREIVEATLAYADACLTRRQFDAPQAALAEAASRATAAGESLLACDVVLMQGLVALHRGYEDEAREAFRHVLSKTADDDRARRVRAQGNLILLARDPEEVRAGIAWLGEAADAAAKDQDPVLEGRIRLNRSYLLGEHDTPGRARIEAEQALALAQLVGDRANEALCLSNLVYLEECLGLLGAAEFRAREAEALAREIQDHNASALAVINRCHILVHLGRLSEANAALDALQDRWRGRTDPRVRHALDRVHGLVRIAAGEASEALPLLDRALQGAHSAEDRARTALLRGRALHAMGCAPEAAGAYESAAREAASEDQHGWRALALARLAALDVLPVEGAAEALKTHGKRLPVLDRIDALHAMAGRDADGPWRDRARALLQQVLDRMEEAERGVFLAAHPGWETLLPD